MYSNSGSGWSWDAYAPVSGAVSVTISSSGVYVLDSNGGVERRGYDCSVVETADPPGISGGTAIVSKGTRVYIASTFSDDEGLSRYTVGEEVPAVSVTRGTYFVDYEDVLIDLYVPFAGTFTAALLLGGVEYIKYVDSEWLAPGAYRYTVPLIVDEGVVSSVSRVEYTNTETGESGVVIGGHTELRTAPVVEFDIPAGIYEYNEGGRITVGSNIDNGGYLGVASAMVQLDPITSADPVAYPDLAIAEGDNLHHIKLPVYAGEVGCANRYIVSYHTEYQRPSGEICVWVEELGEELTVLCTSTNDPPDEPCVFPCFTIEGSRAVFENGKLFDVRMRAGVLDVYADERVGEIIVYDLRGRVAMRVGDFDHSAEVKRMSVRARSLASGVYYVGTDIGREAGYEKVLVVR